MFRYIKLGMFALIATLFSTSMSMAKVVGEDVKYMIDGQEFTGYVAYDVTIQTPRPGVLVVHEWWGHNAYARQRADMLAKLGYTAFALDMYGSGKLASHPKDAKAFMMETLSNVEIAEKRFDTAHNLLKAHPMVDPSQTAAIGYCFGGGVVLHAARTGRDLKGVISYHGSLAAKERAEKGMVAPKVLVFNGADDPFVKAEQIEALKEEMMTADADFRFVNYAGAVHSFTNPEADEVGEKFNMPVAYNAMADADSWAQTRAFFRDIFGQ